ncbi:SMAD/FHA domain-containing protein [Mucor ambiguus]|uniref:SMAD/FHA domain-containing protein n=1 Tax=Mucor ambiguus TaxID=91626 RepID=A0A0C9M795_9FUNG|nr:SMAD/FHA domain-containing protein [Mucor ambiguus]
MYPVLTSNPSELSPTNTNSTSAASTTTATTTTTNMPRNRSASTTSATSPPPPALITRGFQSLRRAHRRLSNSSPSSPIPSAVSQENNTQQEQQQLTDMTSPTRPSAESADSGNSNNSSSNVVRPRMRLVPNVGISSRSFVFEIIDRELEPSVIYRIGRFSDRNAQTERLSFKSKVVSRNHAELWTEQGKVFIRDIGSSSGTFLNRIRLSPPSHISQPHEVRDGDAIQLGVDYQGGLEPIYRAVRIRVELNRQTQNVNSPFTRTAFQQLRSHLIGTNIPSGTSPQQPPQAASPSNTNSDFLVQPADLGLHREPTKVHEHSNDMITDVSNQVQLSDMISRMPTDMSRADIQECCICLYAIAPFQALFIAPCSHIFHFKCLRPIVFQNYPGFSCPLCRSYFDLEASVAVEVDEVLDAINTAKDLKEKQQQQSPKQSSLSPIDTVPELNEEEEEEAQEHEQEEEERVPSGEDQHHLDTAEGSLRPSSSIQSDLSSDIEEEHPREPTSAAGDVVKTRLEAPSSANDNVATPPVPFISIPEDEAAPASSSSPSPAQAINVNSNHSQNFFGGRTTGRGGEGFLSTTLVGSPIFDTNVLPTSTDSNA